MNGKFCIESEVGGCSTGNSFRFVLACVLAVWLPSGIGSKCLWAVLFPFPFLARGAFPFPFWSWELSLFPSLTPQTSYPSLIGLIGCIMDQSHEVVVHFLSLRLRCVLGNGNSHMFLRNLTVCILNRLLQ